MQARARLQIIIGTAAILLAVPTFLAAATSEERSKVLTGRWAPLATEKLIPNFDWVDVSALTTPAVHPFMMDANAWFIAPILSGKEWASFLRVSSLSSTSALAAFIPEERRTLVSDSALERRLLTSGLFVESQQGVALGIDAVFAEQRFASGTLSPLPGGENILPPLSPLTERSSGVGVALAVGGPIDDRFGWTLGLRSPIDMDAYKSYQGLYSEPGDLDIPATAALGFSAQLVPAASIVIGAEHVFYSDINSVSSFALPNRFLALLGDGNSPTFAWQNLTVYSAALRGQASAWDWSVRYSTSLQPSPTAPLLQQAIDGIQSDVNWSIGVGRALRLGELRFSASYAGAEYVLGSPYYRNTDPADSTHFEFEALWNWRF